MTDRTQCDAVLFREGPVYCALRAEHTTPSEQLPQGSPHVAVDYIDNQTGEPWTWWGFSPARPQE